MRFFQSKSRFQIKGDRNHLRSEEELAAIDKNVADEAFKKYKKILDEYLMANGFAKYKTNAYVRRNQADLLEQIDLQKERYGSKTFTVNYSIMPLYAPYEHIYNTNLGDRLGTFVCGKDVWWDYADDQAAEISFQNVIDAIGRFVLPWFEKYENEDFLKEELSKRKKVRWLDLLEHCTDREVVIAENIEKLKLPKKIGKAVER